MTNEAFVALLESRLDQIRGTLANKAKEYASDVDRLHNFKHAAAVLRCTPAQACVAFMTKHLVSILDIVNSGNYTPALLDEKIGDAINYFILLEAILKESK